MKNWIKKIFMPKSKKIKLIDIRNLEPPQADSGEHGSRDSLFKQYQNAHPIIIKVTNLTDSIIKNVSLFKAHEMIFNAPPSSGCVEIECPILGISYADILKKIFVSKINIGYTLISSELDIIKPIELQYFQSDIFGKGYCDYEQLVFSLYQYHTNLMESNKKFILEQRTEIKILEMQPKQELTINFYPEVYANPKIKAYSPPKLNIKEC